MRVRCYQSFACLNITFLIQTLFFSFLVFTSCGPRAHARNSNGAGQENLGIYEPEDIMPSPPGKLKDKRWEDPSPDKVVAMPTAFMQDKGTMNVDFTTFVPGFFSPGVFNFIDVSYGVTKNFEVRGSMLVPIYYIGFGFYPKFGIQLNKYVRIGYMLDLAVVKPYNAIAQWEYEGCFVEYNSGADNVDLCQPWFIYGGAPLILTIGTKDYHVNLSTHVVNYKGLTYECMTSSYLDPCGELPNQLFIIESAGISLKIWRTFKINIEFLYMFNYISEPHWSRETGMRHEIVLTAGFKIFGKRIYTDFNFIMPVATRSSERFGQDEWEFGFALYPFVSFGFHHP